MAEKNWLQEIAVAGQIAAVEKANEYTRKFGLTLNKEAAKMLMELRQETLKEQERVEFGEGILPKIIYAFCDSPYVLQGNYQATLGRLQEMFYLYKNEMMDEVTDNELLNFMREQFDSVCFGDLDYLEGTCMGIFAEAVRGGYRGYYETEGRGEYSKFDEAQRWDRDLFLQVLKELCW